MPLFHRDIGFPDKLVLPTGRIYLEASSHAKQEAEEDRFLEPDEDKLNIPDSIELEENMVFEVETDEKAVIQKIVVRWDYDEERDLVMALAAPEGAGYSPTDSWRVKTVWINYKDDTHSTLNESQYDDPSCI